MVGIIKPKNTNLYCRRLITLRILNKKVCIDLQKKIAYHLTKILKIGGNPLKLVTSVTDTSNFDAPYYYSQIIVKAQTATFVVRIVSVPGC